MAAFRRGSPSERPRDLPGERLGLLQVLREATAGVHADVEDPAGGDHAELAQRVRLVPTTVVLLMAALATAAVQGQAPRAGRAR